MQELCGSKWSLVRTRKEMAESLRKNYFITKLFKASSGHPRAEDAFSLLELVAVVAILGILSSITIPRIGNIISSSRIDEAKALLNTAAADCLQKGRLNDENKEVIDDTIISDQRLKPIGFQIDKDNDADKCSYFQIRPTNSDDNMRYPIGFSVSDGILSKFATPTSSEQSSLTSCERWAGVNCKQDESLKKLIEWKKNIAAEKTKCENNYTKWLTEDNTTPSKSQRWNPNAETGCPSRPPKDDPESYQTDPTCTPNGCNRDVYGLDGEFVGFTKENYDQALENKYGNLCAEWVAEQEQQQITNDRAKLLPKTKTPECGSQQFWFFNGEDQGTKEKFMERACNAWIEDKKRENYTNPSDSPVKTTECGDQEFWFFEGEEVDSYLLIESAKCDAQHEAWRTTGVNKIYEPIGGPGNCSKQIYVCNNSLVTEDTYYSTDGCGKAPKVCGGWHGFQEPKCKEHENSTYMRKLCPVRPDLDPTRGKAGYCADVGVGRPGKGINGWDSSPQCRQFAECMGYYNDGKYFD